MFLLLPQSWFVVLEIPQTVESEIAQDWMLLNVDCISSAVMGKQMDKLSFSDFSY